MKNFAKQNRAMLSQSSDRFMKKLEEKKFEANKESFKMKKF